jgi:hypothetical protein
MPAMRPSPQHHQLWSLIHSYNLLHPYYQFSSFHRNASNISAAIFTGCQNSLSAYDIEWGHSQYLPDIEITPST